MSGYIWTNEDFEVFEIPGLRPRMEALITRVRPKLEWMGHELAPFISEVVDQEMFPHVAKHARRTVNPPNDTWVAWSNSKRGYKALPHFQLGMWSTHLFVQFAVIYECERKSDLAERMEQEIDTVMNEIPPHFVWSGDHTQPLGIPHKEMGLENLSNLIDRLKHIKKAELLCGIHIDRSDPVLQDGQAFIERVKHTIETVAPLYRMV